MLTISSATWPISSLTTKQNFHDSTDPACPTLGILSAQKMPKLCYHLSFSLKDHDRLHRAKNRYMLLHCDNNTRRRDVPLLISAAAPDKHSNLCAKDFPKIIIKKRGMVTVKNWKGYKTVGSGIIYKDFQVGDGETIERKEQVFLRYSIYKQTCEWINGEDFKGSLGQLTSKLDPAYAGFKEGIRGMKPGGRRMIIIPLSTALSKSSPKEHRVFDVEFFS